jgi:4-carboxymuconolactone decarboxylase
METYYHPQDLPKFEEIGEEAPELAKKFFDYYAAVFAEGELTEREKALIALAVAHTVQCPYCIDAYTQACLEKGSNLSEMTEAVGGSIAGSWGPDAEYCEKNLPIEARKVSDNRQKRLNRITLNIPNFASLV